MKAPVVLITVRLLCMGRKSFVLPYAPEIKVLPYAPEIKLHHFWRQTVSDMPCCESHMQDSTNLKQQ